MFLHSHGAATSCRACQSRGQLYLCVFVSLPSSYCSLSNLVSLSLCLLFVCGSLAFAPRFFSLCFYLLLCVFLCLSFSFPSLSFLFGSLSRSTPLLLSPNVSLSLFLSVSFFTYFSLFKLHLSSGSHLLWRTGPLVKSHLNLVIWTNRYLRVQ